MCNSFGDILTIRQPEIQQAIQHTRPTSAKTSFHTGIGPRRRYGQGKYLRWTVSARKPLERAFSLEYLENIGQGSLYLLLGVPLRTFGGSGGPTKLGFDRGACQ